MLAAFLAGSYVAMQEQLSAARGALEELGVGARPLIALAKREEEVYVCGRTEPVRLSRRSPALRLLQQARDEAHRFALTYQRTRRTMRTVTSGLLTIPGIGPAKRRLLLNEFGSIEGIREAGVEGIAKLRGFTEASARKLLEQLDTQQLTAVQPTTGSRCSDERGSSAQRG